MKSVILFRDSEIARGEIDIARQYCQVEQYRTTCKDSLVYCRYSCLPFYQELEEELRYNGCQIINTYSQHCYIADFHYYADVAKYTFPSWNSLAETAYDGPFVVKGKTNSRKHQWSTHMFAPDRQVALDIARELNNDGLIGFQGLVFRKYIPLKTFEIGINGMPFTNEWRLFYLGTKLLAAGYYWSLVEDLSQAHLADEGIALANEVAKIVSDSVNFFVLDIAEKEDGGWILVEVNDAQMSGTSLLNLDELYRNLAEEMETFKPI